MSKQHARELASCQKRIARLNRQEDKLTAALTKQLARIKRAANLRHKAIERDYRKQAAVANRSAKAQMKALSNETTALIKRVQILNGRIA